MTENSGTARGVLLVLVSAASFGLMVVLAKLAYAEGLNSRTLLAMRFSIAAAGMWLIWALQYGRGRRAALSLGALLPLVVMGAVGYVGQSFSYFTAAELMSATATGLLLYTYPVLVTLLARVFYREALTPVKLLALFLALLGALMVLGIFSQILGVSGGGDVLGALNPQGVAWGLSAALVYSGYIIAGTRFAQGVNPIFASAIIISSAALVYVIWGWLANSFTVPMTPLGLLWTLLIALVCTVLAISTFFAGLSIIGPSRAAIVSTVEPAVTVLSAALILGETISLEQATGAALIMAGVLILQLGSRKPSVKQSIAES
jgi:drug/metabolite transporter (DMT)-like permease